MTSEQIGIQLYSLRERLSTAPLATIKQVSCAGFRTAEGFDVLYLSQLKPLLDDFRVAVKSSFLLSSYITEKFEIARHYNYPWLPNNPSLDQVLEQAHELGLDTLVCGYLFPEERETADDIKRLAQRLNAVGEKCANAGISLLYHNHTFEFATMPDIHNPFTYLMKHTDESNVNVELDILWAKLAGQSPVKIANELGSRLHQVHLKTSAIIKTPIYCEQQLAPEQHDVPLGQGVITSHELELLIHNPMVKRAFIEQEFGQNILSSLVESQTHLRHILDKSNYY